MIGKLIGKLDSKTENSLIVDVGGVGYIVFASAKTLSKLPGAGEAVKLFVETHVREDHIHLYGFLSEAEKGWFNLLQTVQGVGAKVALGILSSFGPEQLAQIFASQDKAMIGKASGIGPKLAIRLVTELKGKSPLLGAGNFVVSSEDVSGDAFSSALSALANLGYMRTEAAMVLNKILKENPKMEEAELIQAALKEYGKKK